MNRLLMTVAVTLVVLVATLLYAFVALSAQPFKAESSRFWITDQYRDDYGNHFFVLHDVALRAWDTTGSGGMCVLVNNYKDKTQGVATTMIPWRCE